MNKILLGSYVADTSQGGSFTASYVFMHCIVQGSDDTAQVVTLLPVALLWLAIYSISL